MTPWKIGILVPLSCSQMEMNRVVTIFKVYKCFGNLIATPVWVHPFRVNSSNGLKLFINTSHLAWKSMTAMVNTYWTRTRMIVKILPIIPMVMPHSMTPNLTLRTILTMITPIFLPLRDWIGNNPHITNLLYKHIAMSKTKIMIKLQEWITMYTMN